jgi:hypothetical protein
MRWNECPYGWSLSPCFLGTRSRRSLGLSLPFQLHCVNVDVKNPANDRWNDLGTTLL